MSKRPVEHTFAQEGFASPPVRSPLSRFVIKISQNIFIYLLLIFIAKIAVSAWE